VTQLDPNTAGEYRQFGPAVKAQSVSNLVRIPPDTVDARTIEISRVFAGWLVANHEQVARFLKNNRNGGDSTTLFTKLHADFDPSGIGREDFIELALKTPFEQVLLDLEQFCDPEAHDKDQDMRDFVHEFLEPQPGETLLDAGCSTGRNFSRFNGVRCIGVDLDLSGLFVGEAAFSQLVERHPAPVFHYGNVLELPLEDGEVDKLQSFVVVSLVPIRKALAEFRRVLKPGGKIAFTVEGTGFWSELNNHRRKSGASLPSIGLTRWLVGRKLQESGVYLQGHPIFGRLAGIMMYTPETIAKEMNSAGFKSVRTSVLRTHGDEARLIGVSAIAP